MSDDVASGNAIQRRAFADYPEALVPDGRMDILYHYDDPDFGIVGVDGDRRIVIGADDGIVAAYDLDDDPVEDTRFGLRLRGSEAIVDQQFPEEYAHRHDLSDWLWVHPRFRWLVGDVDV